VPSKSELRHHYGVAPGTVEKAFAVLRAEGLVEDVRGRGLFVMDEDEGPPRE
jgi:DNA-binding GntR family transcriptional regulator